LAGCTGWDQRRGIDPVINPAAVELATSNQIRILTALAQDASIPLSGPVSWYEVTQAGFNFVDDECRSYFNAIFFLNREKDQIKSGLAAAGATTAAVLGLTGASAKSIAIVAEAFGLGIISTDLVAGTYLYQMPPSVAQGFVKEMQLAYRDGAATRRRLINTPSAAYRAIQDYLSLCLPPTIEAKIAEHVAGARAVPDPTTGNGNPSFGITIASPPPVTREEVRRLILTNPDTPMQRPPVQPPKFLPTRLTPFERNLSDKDIRSLQTALCVNPDGDLGPLNSQTRLQLNKFLRTIPPEASPPPPDQMITNRIWSRFLIKLIDANKPFCT
jgi:hypothetical protein